MQVGRGVEVEEGVEGINGNGEKIKFKNKENKKE